MNTDTARALGPWQPLHFDVTAPPTKPDWLVQDLIARGTVTILSGDTSSAKSFASLALAMAVLGGGKSWLGRPVKGPGRVLIIEGEMPRWEVEDRLRGFGLRNEHWQRLLYLDKSQSVVVDLAEQRERLLLTIDAFRPDLVVLDTIFSLTCQTEVNDPTSVARFFTETLRPLAQHTSLLAQHHENKASRDVRDVEQKMTGARQWAAQADRHLILTAINRGKVDKVAVADGHVRSSYALRLDSGKTRGSEKPSLQLSLDTEEDRAGHRVWIDLRVVGETEPETDRLIDSIRELLEGRGETATAEIVAAQVGSRRSIERALALGVDAGAFRKVDRGLYGPNTAPSETAAL